ncbi:CopD family protein, partial [Alicyclobacillus sp.]|uniref:CopD family protein n=1 Tax=Alicyclobacillus sp. TaxID=61169 RepID=UPI0025BA7713
GLYSAHWRVVSADGHPVAGTLPFSVGHGAPVTQASVTGYTPGWDAVLIRWAGYLGLSFAAGTLAFRRFVLPETLRTEAGVKLRLAHCQRVGWVLLVCAVLAALPLQARLDAGVGWGRALSPSTWWPTLASTRFGTLWAARLGLTVAALAMRRLGPGPLAVWGTFAACVGIMGTMSASGHAVSGPHPAWSIAMDTLHLAAATLWIGSLAGMGVGLGGVAAPGNREESAARYWETMRRFAPWGLGSVGVLVATGWSAASVNIPSRYAWVHTAYGQTLLLKLTAFLLMFGLAAHHWMRARRAPARRRRTIQRTIAIELGLGIAVFAVTSYLTNLPPASATPGPVNETATLPGGVRATLRIDPNEVGDNRFEVDLADRGGRPVTAIQQVTLTFTSLDMDMGAATVRLLPAGPGVYRAQGLYLTMAGRWRGHLHVLTADLSDWDTDFRFVVGQPQ